MVNRVLDRVDSDTVWGRGRVGIKPYHPKQLEQRYQGKRRQRGTISLRKNRSVSSSTTTVTAGPNTCSSVFFGTSRVLLSVQVGEIQVTRKWVLLVYLFPWTRVGTHLR